MGGRCWVTGVQLGMLKAFIELGRKEDFEKLLGVIEKDQFIGEIPDNTDDWIICIQPKMDFENPK